MEDIYCLFYEKGITITKEKGHLCFITSNKWMRAGYGEKLRKFFLKYNPKILIDLGPCIFESATVDTNILLLQKQRRTKLQLNALTFKKEDEISIDEQLKRNGVVLQKLSKDAWFIGSRAEQRLKEKIERIGKPLKEWDVNIYYGIKTGLNEAFIITTEKRNEILANCKDDEERRRTDAIIKPILRGRDIKRYYYEWAGLWVIVIPAGWTNENKGKMNAEKFISQQFYSLMQYLKPFEERAKKRDDQGDYWWELRHCAYYPEFEKEKIIYPNMTKFLPFVYDGNGFYTNQKCFILISDSVPLKYLGGFLNSNISQKWIRDNCPELQGGTRELSYIFFQNIPLPPSPPPTSPLLLKSNRWLTKSSPPKKPTPKPIPATWNAR